jgi:branched-chain amino acid transport system ATP-binding protein
MARTFQIVKPFLTISVLENVMVAALLRETSVKKARESAMEIIALTGLDPMTHAKAESLPLPLRKRLELARALATQSKLLLLDEVMAGLTPSEVDEIIALIREINGRGIGILLIEHVMRGLMALSQRVIVINYGQQIAEGVPEEVVKDQQVIEAYLGKEFISAQGQ